MILGDPVVSQGHGEARRERARRSPRRRRPTFAPTLVLLPILACAVAAEPEDRAGELRVVEDALVVEHLLSGELEAERAVELGVPEVGVAPLQIRWLAENGSEVEAGELVVDLDNSALVSNLEQLEGDLVQALMQLDQAHSQAGSDEAEALFQVKMQRAAVEKARIAADIPDGLKAARDYERLKLEERKADLELAEAEEALDNKRRIGEAAVAIAHIEVEKAEKQLAGARSGIDELAIRAPRRGVVVIQENPREDRLWQVGDNTFLGWTLVELPELDSLVVRARLFDVDDGTIAAGLPARVTLDAYPDTDLRGRVREVSPVAREIRGSRARAFDVLVELDGIDSRRMLPGMSARVVVEERIEADSRGRRAPLLAAREALDLEAPDGPRARLADGATRPVTLGRCNALACIVEEGLAAGERLASRFVDAGAR
jgi:HlyD family secretion protein